VPGSLAREGLDAEAAAGEEGGALSSGVGGTSSIFHGREAVDYQGRAWCATPKGVRSDEGDHECFLPSRAGAKLTGHNKAVQSVAFIPGTGHLLSSASMDGKVKVWDVEAKRVMRTYLGHSAAVREAKWDTAGARLLSASYDRSAKVWDVETGACLMSLEHGAIPYSGVWHPDDPHTVLLGSANRKIMQHDVRTGEVALEYNYHLGPVNTVTFIDENR